MTVDNICKYLAEQEPGAFVRWLLSKEVNEIQILKTELSVEPIRADALILLQIDDQVLHLEFQTLPESKPAIPFRMLDYWVRLRRQYGTDIEQVVIFLKSTTSEAVFIEQFEAPNTRHRYRVIRLWEQDPEPLLANPALLPLACLAKSESPNALLERVALQVARIEEPQQRQNLSASVTVLAGLRFDEILIDQLFGERYMQESVIYQRILRQGLEQGRQEGREEGRQQGHLAVIMRQIVRRLGAIQPAVLDRLQKLSISQLEELGEALLDFQESSDLIAWLDNRSAQ
ncbi:MAG: Rpn family recombination-promoting nuclease/putative transposase [Microcoleus vaginatus WJT46-NPBG5]|nr:Rpn family recombination-promoting nuclease/putative transposase [Microcoleus vaginatus WJT46-NPBG5]